jgi:hypothetical protein
VTGARRTGWTIVAVLGGAALALRASDALPGFIASVPRGVYVCASLAEAESRTGLGLESLQRDLADYQPMVNGIRATAKPVPAVAVSLRGGQGTEPQLMFFRSRGGEISPSLRPPLPAFHEIAIPITPDRVASLRAGSMGDGSVWQDLEWSDRDGRTALRFGGRTVDLLRVARRIVEGER